MNLVRKVGPFIESPQSTSKIMRNIMISLIPIIIYSFYRNGMIPYQNNVVGTYGLFYPLLSLFIASLTSFIIEFLYQIIFLKRNRKDEIIFDIKHNYGFIPGLLVGLLLPYGCTIPVIFIGAFSATIIGKLVFGGFGTNTLNSTLIGILVVIVIFGSINSLRLDPNIYTLGNSAITNIEDINTNIKNNELVTPYGGLNNFFIGDIPGSPADISSIICIIAFIFLTLTKSIKWRITLTTVSTVFILTTIYGLINNYPIWYGLIHILSGGLLFMAIFISNDSVTTPVTKLGMNLFGISLGILTVLFRTITPYYLESILFSTLILNMIVFLLDDIALKYKMKKTVLFFPMIILAILMICPYIF